MRLLANATINAMLGLFSIALRPEHSPFREAVYGGGLVLLATAIVGCCFADFRQEKSRG